MISILKYFGRICLIGAISIITITSLLQTTQAKDLLETAYDQSTFFDYTPKIGNNRSSVGNGLFRTSYTLGKGGFTSQDPLFVRTIKRLLQLVVIISIPLLIFAGIRYMIASGDETGQQSARRFITNILIGLILALASLAIIALASSIFNETRIFGWKEIPGITNDIVSSKLA